MIYVIYVIYVVNVIYVVDVIYVERRRGGGTHGDSGRGATALPVRV
ncbi:MAG: hypothetical protein K2I37_02060 [Muribaculaceae bacterium]|nr:hypothetical protein [Muribaculaceae bacterium]